MANFRIFQVVVIFFIIQMSTGGRISRDSDSSTSSAESEESDNIVLTLSELEIVKSLQLDEHKLKIIRDLGISLHQLQNLFTVVGVTRGRRVPLSEVAVIDDESDTEISDFNNVECSPLKARVCAIILEEEGFDNITLTSGQRSYLNHLEFKVFQMSNEEKIPFIKSIVCPYVRDPKVDEEYGKSLGLSITQYHTFKNIGRQYDDSTKSAAARVLIARESCHILQSSELIADITAKSSNIELTEQQVSQFDELENQSRIVEESLRAPAFKNLCDFLNETVNHVEQAQALKIPLDLYEKVVVIRKNNSDDYSVRGRLGAIREICKAINHQEGVFNLESPQVADLSPDDLFEVSSLLTNAIHAENAEKFPKLRNVCVFLNESLTEMELANRAGVSLQQYQDIALIAKNNEDSAPLGQLTLTIQMCQVLNRAQNESANSIRSIPELTAEQLTELHMKLAPISTIPIDQRVALWTEVCEWFDTTDKAANGEETTSATISQNNETFVLKD